MSYIIAIETAVPEFCHQQKNITTFFVNSTNNDNTKRKLNYISEKSGINTRHSVLNDFSLTQTSSVLFKHNNNNTTPLLTKRMALYKLHAKTLALNAVNKIANFDEVKKTITHIITVTCTGLFAPGLDIDLIRELNLNATTQRSSINFMGCNAAILALNNANNICNSINNANVLIVCVELCTIHFQNNNTDDNILANTLFADGAAAIIVSANKQSIINENSIKIKNFNSLIIHKGQNDMAWQLSETGFLMNLTSYVSELINGNISLFLDEINLKKTDINYWAIHPGGKKIIDDFATTLNLSNNELQSSYEILSKYGNMSSPTVLFVLKHLIENTANVLKNETIFVAAFGPGLSIETLQLQYV